MVLDKRCNDCFKTTYSALMQKFPVSPTGKLEFEQYLNQLLINPYPLSSPMIQRELHLKLKKLTGIDDFFKDEKESSNTLALKLLKEWKPIICNSNNSLDISLRLAIAGNIIDYGANNPFNIQETIEQALLVNFAIDHSRELKNQLGKAKRVLYLGDNAGEIVFDKLFIETLNHPEVSFIVKSAPILNDVTFADAKMVEMEQVANVVSNGFDAPSTILEHSGKEFLELFNSADVIISKGQGNFEGLFERSDPRIFYLFIAKCEVIADLINVRKGSFVVMNSTL